jgi:hypothetical protein
LHYIGDKGIDFSVELQFEVPPDTDLEPLFDEIGCSPLSGGTPNHSDPFDDSPADWYVTKAGYPSHWCIMDAAPIDEHRGVRTIAQSDGSTVVQVQVFGY